MLSVISIYKSTLLCCVGLSTPFSFEESIVGFEENIFVGFLPIENSWANPIGTLDDSRVSLEFNCDVVASIVDQYNVVVL